MEIRKAIGRLRHYFLDADSHSCLEKPRSIARLFHIYHRPGGDPSIRNKTSSLKTIRGGCAHQHSKIARRRGGQTSDALLYEEPVHVMGALYPPSKKEGI